MAIWLVLPASEITLSTTHWAISGSASSQGCPGRVEKVWGHQARPVAFDLTFGWCSKIWIAQKLIILFLGGQLLYLDLFDLLLVCAFSLTTRVAEEFLLGLNSRLVTTVGVIANCDLLLAQSIHALEALHHVYLPWAGYVLNLLLCVFATHFKRFDYSSVLNL